MKKTKNIPKPACVRFFCQVDVKISHFYFVFSLVDWNALALVPLLFILLLFHTPPFWYTHSLPFSFGRSRSSIPRYECAATRVCSQRARARARKLPTEHKIWICVSSCCVYNIGCELLLLDICYDRRCFIWILYLCAYSECGVESIEFWYLRIHVERLFFGWNYIARALSLAAAAAAATVVAIALNSHWQLVFQLALRAAFWPWVFESHHIWFCRCVRRSVHILNFCPLANTEWHWVVLRQPRTQGDTRWWWCFVVRWCRATGYAMNERNKMHWIIINEMWGGSHFADAIDRNSSVPASNSIQLNERCTDLAGIYDYFCIRFHWNIWILDWNGESRNRIWNV